MLALLCGVRGRGIGNGVRGRLTPRGGGNVCMSLGVSTVRAPVPVVERHNMHGLMSTQL
jgi:hypothetical protein